MKVNGAVHAVAALVLMGALGISGCEGGGGGGDTSVVDGGQGSEGATEDYTGQYYVAIGHEPRYSVAITRNSPAMFALTGGGMSGSGSVAVSGDAMTLTGTVDGAPFVATTALAADRRSFEGTWTLTMNDEQLSGTIIGTKAAWPTYDLVDQGVPRFVAAHCVDPASIEKISIFRSAAGHVYVDDLETCRTMKHYLDAYPSMDLTGQSTRAPVAGTVIGFTQEDTGKAIGIRSLDQPAFTFIIYHLHPPATLMVGSTVAAGDSLGTQAAISSDHAAQGLDIAVGVNTATGYRLVSYFDVMTDAFFRDFQARGVGDRGDLQISRAERDTNPLACSADEEYTNGDDPQRDYFWLQ